MPTELRLPDLGENIESGNVVRVAVRKGDTVAEGDVVMELETDKATLEIPSSASGTVADVMAKEGDTINVGDVFLVIQEGEGAPPEQAEKKAKTKPAEKAVSPPPEEEQPKRKPAAKEAAKPVEVKAEAEEPAPEEAEPVAPVHGEVRAAPSVRRLAREIGVDISQVRGSDAGGRVTAEDVKKFAQRVNVETREVPARPAAQRPAAPPPEFERFGPVERERLSGVRRRIAEHMAYAWTTIPHVTQFDKADITELEKLRREYGETVAQAGGKLTVTAIAVKVVALALQRFPRFNASLDTENGELVYKKYYNIGVAVDTERGLLVPVVRDVDTKSITEIAVEIGELAQKARDGKASLDEMKGGTFTITNLGGIGGANFAPIVNAPEVAILGLSRTQTEPVFVDGTFQPRQVLPLALSYDHRVIDGADGARFLRWIAQALEQPFRMVLEG